MFRKCHAIFHVKSCNSLLGSVVKGTDRLILLGLRVSDKVPLARPWSGYSRLDLLIRGLLAITKGFPHPTKTDTCCCGLISLCKIQLIRRTGRQCVPSPSVFLLRDIILAGRHDAIDFNAWSAPSSVSKTPSCLGHPPGVGGRVRGTLMSVSR